jgi:hypothetical protein
MTHIVKHLVGNNIRDERSHIRVSTTNLRFHPEPLHHLESKPKELSQK